MVRLHTFKSQRIWGFLTPIHPFLVQPSATRCAVSWQRTDYWQKCHMIKYFSWFGEIFWIWDLGEPLSFKNSLTSRSSRKADEGENEILEYDSLAEMKNQMSDFWMTRPRVMMITYHLWNKRLLFTMDDFPQFERSVCFNSRIVFS